MITNHREILFLYNHESSRDRKALAYAKSVIPEIKSYTFKEFVQQSTYCYQIFLALNLDPKELTDKSSAYYQTHLRGKEFDWDDWLNIFCSHPEIIKAPIAVRGDQAILCLNPKDIYKLKA